MTQNETFIIKYNRGVLKMEKNLPKVFANPINKPITNNREYHVIDPNKKERKKVENIPEKINQIFASPTHVYKSKVRITIKGETIETIMVGKTTNHLLTLNGEKIRINDIEDIEKI